MTTTETSSKLSRSWCIPYINPRECSCVASGFSPNSLGWSIIFLGVTLPDTDLACNIVGKVHTENEASPQKPTYACVCMNVSMRSRLIPLRILGFSLWVLEFSSPFPRAHLITLVASVVECSCHPHLQRNTNRQTVNQWETEPHSFSLYKQRTLQWRHGW